MKTKYIWAPEDVCSGMIVCRAHRGIGKWKPDGWAAKWTYKIGFVAGDGTTTKGSNGRYTTNQFCKIAMTDGMVCSRNNSHETMADELTKLDMIPMPWSWWLQMVRYLRKQTQPNAKTKAFLKTYR